MASLSGVDREYRCPLGGDVPGCRRNPCHIWSRLRPRSLQRCGSLPGADLVAGRAPPKDGVRCRYRVRERNPTNPKLEDEPFIHDAGVSPRVYEAVPQRRALPVDGERYLSFLRGKRVGLQ
ncbi:Hypothetical protein SMAX5B_011289, partial [Scophthalmus maximus]